MEVLEDAKAVKKAAHLKVVQLKGTVSRDLGARSYLISAISNPVVKLSTTGNEIKSSFLNKILYFNLF